MLFKTALHTLFGSLRGETFQVHYWDGEDRRYGDGTDSAFTLRFHREPPAQLENPLVYLGECYSDGIYDIDGDWNALFRLISDNKTRLIPDVVGRALQRVGDTLGKLKRNQKNNIAHHYDLGNAFYRLWLDDTMCYSCAFFRHPDDSLEQAQLNKIALCLDKLGIEPGMRLLDIGCGWGQLALAAAERGARVVGLTLSEEQAAGARIRIAERGLSDKVEIRLMDYLDLNGEVERFDRIVSVGMFEHVGRAHYTDFFDRAADSLEPGGLMLLHSITSLDSDPTNPWIDKYIFPGGQIPALAEIVDQLGGHDLHLLQAESLRLHYARTLEHWLERFNSEREAVRALFDEQFVRMWTLYLKGSAASFRSAGLDIHQLLLSKGLNNHLPRHWGHLYYEGEAPQRW